jgi:ATP-dependent DNA helicase RecG
MDNDLSGLQIQYIKGVGPRRAEIFSRLGIKTIHDALYCLPKRYEDRNNIKNICELKAGDIETVRGLILSADVIGMRRSKFKIFELTVNDGTGVIRGKWFNQPFMKKNFRTGQEVLISGTVKNAYRGGGLEIDNPEYELVVEDEDTFIHSKRTVPVYRLTQGIGQRQFRKIMFGIVNAYADKLQDPVPPEIIRKNSLPVLTESIKQVHFPEENIDLELLNRGITGFHKRLYFEELFIFETGLAIIKKISSNINGISFKSSGKLSSRLLSVLPFELTNAQKRTIEDILRDMGRPCPMNRLIQGDVGCGKTVVALIAMLNAVECGYQAALMAPTEILAEQHFINIYKLIEQLGLSVELLTGGPKKEKLERIESGGIDIIVGTHALIQEGVKFRKLGLAVIDEQHKFGVIQRAVLRKKGLNPDILLMTATPIPRSLSLTLYGDIDCSVIDEIPPGRKPVTTRLFTSGQKEEIYSLIREAITKGRQAYVVYPAIDESEKISLKNAIQGKEAFEKIFPEFRTGLLHGRMNPVERESVMLSFKKHEIDILVCTTVIEVGVDVPDATIMLIIHAERFGLAQLHQLRGRVGRGTDSACCILVAYEPYGDEAGKRLDIMLSSGDGFRIAEEDLQIRGPGEFLGTRQAGLPELKIADIVRDAELLDSAKRDAFVLVDEDPELKKNPSLKKAVEVFWKGKADLYKTG